MALVIMVDFRFTSRWKTHVATYPGSIAKVPGAPDLTPEFGQDISFVTLEIIEIISDLPLGGKLMLVSIQAPSTNYLEHLFSSTTKSNIEM